MASGRRRKRPEPRFAAGRQALVWLYGKRKVVTVTGEPKWNGFTWMYEFEDEDVRLGEMYLTAMTNAGKDSGQ
jgi:hypothetical protein